jgi:hypothetical protein
VKAESERLSLPGSGDLYRYAAEVEAFLDSQAALSKRDSRSQ